MNKKLFHGYNCFSAVIGQHLLNIGREDLLDAIKIHWSFDFNPYLFWEKSWYVGTCVEPTDYLLQYDLQVFDGIITTKYKADRIRAQTAMTEVLNKYSSHIVMIDFYYLEFWNRLHRFTATPQHNPHFINVVEQTKDSITYQDPLYNYCGKMDKDQFLRIRNNTVRKIDIDFEYYTVELEVKKAQYTNRDRLYFQFERYLKQEQYLKINEFGDAVFNRIESKMDMDDKEWMINAYNSLQSIVYQHLNISKVITKENINLQQELKALVQAWTQIRQYFYDLYFNDTFQTASQIKELLYRIGQEEQSFSNKLITIIGG